MQKEALSDARNFQYLFQIQAIDSENSYGYD